MRLLAMPRRTPARELVLARRSACSASASSSGSRSSPPTTSRGRAARARPGRARGAVVDDPGGRDLRAADLEADELLRRASCSRLARLGAALAALLRLASRRSPGPRSRSGCFFSWRLNESSFFRSEVFWGFGACTTCVAAAGAGLGIASCGAGASARARLQREPLRLGRLGLGRRGSADGLGLGCLGRGLGLDGAASGSGSTTSASSSSRLVVRVLRRSES